MTDQPTNCITFHESGYEPGKEVIRLDKEGFHYRDQFIADAGEAHRLMVEFLRQNTKPEPQGPTDEELTELWFDHEEDDGVIFPSYARAVLARWGRPKPPSLKEQALEHLEQIHANAYSMGMGFDPSIIRRALEQLDD